MTNQRPLPDEIYVRRRVGALVILLLLVALVIWGLSALARSGADSHEKTAGTAEQTAVTQSDAPVTEPTVPAPEDATTTATTTATAAETTETTATAETVAEEEAGASRSEMPLAKGSCELADLRIVTYTEHPSYKVGDSPKLLMNVENPTDTDCELDLADGEVRFEVYNMTTNARVWSDIDCSASIVVGTERFPAGEVRPFEAVWSGTGSAPSQCVDRKTVPAGSYYLHAVIGDNASDPAPFNFTA